MGCKAHPINNNNQGFGMQSEVMTKFTSMISGPFQMDEAFSTAADDETLQLQGTIAQCFEDLISNPGEKE